MQNISSAAFSDTKPHYELLDGLRGVAALLVVWYHVFEGYAFAGGTLIEGINHGYLAVDFFFILSGFVIGYAYDDRWGRSLTLKNFFKRRLIRLHPMVVMGAVLGAITFCLQGRVQWDGTHVATSMVMLALLCAMFFIPAVPGAGYEVRGNGEIDLETARAGLDMLAIDEMGLDAVDRRMLATMIEKFGGRPVGLDTIAAATGDDATTIEDVYEPYLMQLGFLTRTPRGRCVTQKAYEHLHVAFVGQQRLDL